MKSQFFGQEDQMENQMKEVLFQKMGNRWFVFTEINNDVIYSALPEGMDPRTTKLELYDVIEDHMIKVAEYFKRTPEAAA